MNTLDLIDNDYKLLHSEMKKKYTHIKDVCCLRFINCFSLSKEHLRLYQTAKGHKTKQTKVLNYIL